MRKIITISAFILGLTLLVGCHYENEKEGKKDDTNKQNQEMACKNFCGDGECLGTTVQCIRAEDCPCTEDEINCPKDCPAQQNNAFCLDSCGDGECAEVVCEGENCPCAESSKNCPADCTETEIANPASVYCEEQDGKLEIRTTEDGSQTGYCMFDNGSECEEWAFMRGECKKTENAKTDSTSDSDFCLQAGGELSTITECEQKVNTCILKDGTECPLDQFVKGECEEGVIVEWGEACKS